MKRKYAEGGEVPRKKLLRGAAEEGMQEAVSDKDSGMMSDISAAVRKGAVAGAAMGAKRRPTPKNPDDIPPRNLQEAKDEMIRRKEEKAPTTKTEMGKLFKAGGKVGSASKRADGIAQRGKTRGRMM